ncbi:alpha/beta fold hydrolase [Maricaulis salignorans]|uniref:alpha/beta fold hydrolase n=1 Tax=Maricaulis salignorans TaxID=144026 RepID=UPI003A90714E
MSRTVIAFIVLAALIVIGALAWMLTRPAAEPALDQAARLDSPYWTDADRLVDIDGVMARVRSEGPADAPVIVMVHGFSYSLESWDGWAADLSSDYRVIRMDLPGHGLTGPDPQQRYSVPQTVDFLGHLLDELGLDHVTLAGNSLGGLVSWRLAAERPDLVERLVLVAPGAYSINGVTEQPVAVPMGVSFYLTSAPEAMVAAASAGLFGDISRMDPALPGRVHALMQTPGVGQALVERLEVFTLPDPAADLARVQVPALVLWGGRDVMIPVEQAARIADDLSQAELIIHDDLGHILHEEDPARTIADVRAFLAQ